MSDRVSGTLASAETEFDMGEGEVVEIPLLLSGWQVSALETAAHNRGLTAAEMVRRVLREFLAKDSRIGNVTSSNGSSSLRS